MEKNKCQNRDKSSEPNFLAFLVLPDSGSYSGKIMIVLGPESSQALRTFRLRNGWKKACLLSGFGYTPTRLRFNEQIYHCGVFRSFVRPKSFGKP